MKSITGCFVMCLVSLSVWADDASPTWTTDLAKMQFPDAPVKGKVLGGDFSIDVVKLDGGTVLKLHQGKNTIPDAAVIVFLPIKPGQSLEGKKFEFGEGSKGEAPLSVHVKRRPTPKDLPKGDAYTLDYTLKLEFDKAKDDKLPGKIYLCLPDEGKSVVAGTFTLNLK